MLNNNRKSAHTFSNLLNSKGFVGLKIVLGIVVLLLVAGGAYLLFFSSTKVSQTFIDKYNEIADSKKDLMSALTTEIAVFEQVQAKDKAMDYKGAAKLVDDTLTQNSGIVGKIELHKQRVAELREMSSKIGDSEVKGKAVALISLLEEEDIHLAKGFDYQKQLLEMLSTYYKELIAGKTPSLTEASANDIIAKTVSEGSILADLSNKVEVAREVFFKSAGLELETSETQPSANTTGK